MKGTIPRKAKATFGRFVTSRYQTLNADGGALSRVFAGVRTTLGAPRFPLKYTLAGVSSALMPPKHLFAQLNNGGSWDQYEAGYRNHLDSVGTQAIDRELSTLLQSSGRETVALLCFCEKDAPCHRRIFASWWEEQTGEAIPEL